MAALPTPQRADAQANRAKLIAAARAVFAERGFDAEMKEIAERAGVGMGTIYRNFVNKDELIDAMVRDRIAVALDLLAETRSIADPAKRLEAMLQIAWSRAEEDGALISALHDSAREPPVEVLTELREVFAAGQASGSFRRELDIEAFPFFVAAQFETYLMMRRVWSAERTGTVLTDLVLHAALACEGAAGHAG